MDHRSQDYIKKQLDEATKWVGMYIAAASAVCTCDDCRHISWLLKQKTLVPSKYFSLNTTSLTLLAAAMKPPMDLSDELYKDIGSLTKDTSLNFMCAVMVSFMSSFGSMNNQMVLTNTVALGILALTVVGNMSIQIVLLVVPFGGFGINFLEATIFVIVLLVTFVSSAVTVPSIKRNLELKYQEMHKATLRDEQAVQRNQKFTIANQRGEMKKYWVMAETSNPQFVMACSVVSTTSSAICLLAMFTLGGPSLGLFIWTPIAGLLSAFTSTDSEETASAYKWSTKWILAIQSVGLVIGLFAPTLRLLNNVTHKCSTLNFQNIKEEFKIENYWTQTIIDWRDNSIALQIRHDTCMKCFHDAKRLILIICVKVQILVVLSSKILVFLFVLLMTSFIASFTLIKRFLVFVYVKLKTRVIQSSSTVVISSNNHVGVGSNDDIMLNLRHYVLLREGEPELLKSTVKRIWQQTDKAIQNGKRHQSENLINLLHKFGNFSGVRDFDNVQVQSLHSQEPPNCWTLPLVTLTSIAIALPNVASHKAKQLLRSVSEGMYLAKLMDEASDTNEELVNMRRTADIAWTEVFMYHKWQDVNLPKTSLSCKNSKEISEKLSKKAESIITEFKREEKYLFMENPLNWPVRVVAANSMYRVAKTVLLSMTEENDPTEEELFHKLSVMIADIFAACLTNLPHVISTMCQQSSIEKREKSVHKAFLLLGKTEGVLELLQQREWPSINPAGYKILSIDEWRAFFQEDDENPKTPVQPQGIEIKTT